MIAALSQVCHAGPSQWPGAAVVLGILAAAVFLAWRITK